MINLDLLEKSLKKRWPIAYNWMGSKQTDTLDIKTKFIYTTRSFKELTNKINDLDVKIQNYALNRWYNFWSAKGVEQLFTTHQNVVANKNEYDKLIDFKLNGIPFDHKSSVFPVGFNNPLTYAKENEQELIKWFYKNQSQEGRKHLKNRLFVVFYNTANQEHWKLKAEISFIKIAIDNYITNFSTNKLYTFDFGEGKVLSGIIWVVK